MTNPTALKEIVFALSRPGDALDWLISLGGWLLIIVIAINAGWAWLARRRSTRIAGLVLLWASLFMFVFVARFRLLVFDEVNPDEGEELAEALTFMHDPRPWGAADGHTHGFPVPVALLPLKLLGLPLDFLGARSIAIGVILLVAAAVGALVRRQLDERASLLASSLVVLCIASVSNWDMQAYNGEYVCLLVATTALVCMLWIAHSQGRARRFAIAGAAVCTTLLPFVKLQVAPLAVFFGCMAAVILVRTVPRNELTKELAVLIAAGTLTLAGLLGVIALGSGFGHFVDCYIKDALVYVTINSWQPGKFADFIGSAAATVGIGPWAAMILAGAVCAVSHGGAEARRVSLATWLSLFATTGVLVFCVFRPNREFHHYLNFVVFSVAALIALVAAQGHSLSKYPTLVSVLLLSAFFWTPGHVLRKAPDGLGRATYEASDAQAGAVIAQFSSPSEAIAVWGWMGRYYVLSQRGSASRHTIVTEREVNQTRNADTFREEYLQDLRAKNPPVFVDSVGPGSFAYDNRATSGHETFPQLAEFVTRRYDFVEEIGRARIYVRKDRLAAYEGSSLSPNSEQRACLSNPAGGAAVALVRCTGRDPKKFDLQRVGAFFQLRNPETDLCMQVSDSKQDAWTLLSWESCAADEHKQLWALVPERDGRNLISRATLECLGANRNSGNVRLRRCRGVASEVWPEPRTAASGIVARSSNM